MTDKEKIRKEIQRLQDLTMDKNKNFYSEAAEGEYNALCNIEHFIDSLQEEPISEELDKAAIKFSKGWGEWDYAIPCFKAGAQWQKNHLWKSADGDDLPKIDREVIALIRLDGFFQIPPDEPVELTYKVVFAHRPPEYWDGKDIVTGKVTRNYPKTYDKGGWNIPNIVYWLDVELPKEIGG